MHGADVSDNIFEHPRLKELLKKMSDVAKKPYWDDYIVIEDSLGITVRRAKSKEEYEKWKDHT